MENQLKNIDVFLYRDLLLYLVRKIFFIHTSSKYYKKVAYEYGIRFDPENNQDRLIKQEDKPYGKLSVGLISHWHNRMLPMKWLLRQFLRYVNESKRKWIDIRGFEDYILNAKTFSIKELAIIKDNLHGSWIMSKYGLSSRESEEFFAKLAG